MDAQTVHEYAAGVIVFARGEDDYCTLLVQHRDGHWGFPKGHIETNESVEQAALRELHEETGLAINAVSSHTCTEEYTFMRNNIRVAKHNTYFVLQLSAMPPVAPIPQFVSEIRAVRWVSFGEAQQLFQYNEYDRLLVPACSTLQHL